MTGADRLLSVGRELLQGKRFALLTNPTGINAELRSTIELCRQVEGAQLAAFFACEHGLRNERQAGVRFEDEDDPVTGLPVYSLYGSRYKPAPYMLRGIDALVVDIQDLGVRFYTYLTTLVYVMEACAAAGVEVIVLDRPNPLGGYRIEGGFLQEGFHSMVGAWRMPAATGMTIGEFARLVSAEMDVPCKLQVVALQGWDRSMEYGDTGLPWMMPSPNIPTIDTVRVYTGTCLLEGTNISEGRGTTRPFETVGAPWMDNAKVCRVMSEMDLPGVRFHSVTYTPTFSKYAGELCRGLMIYVTDKSAFRSAETGLRLLHAMIDLHPSEFKWRGANEDGLPFIDILTGSDTVRRTLAEPGAVDRILQSWREDAESWKQIRGPYLLYGDETSRHAGSDGKEASHHA
ncbi:hypothetical protein VN24_13985 [Paenibacillus beijingensis]|uniref:DUF1343 domain-containing protein n=2 Tax=Paenibacillus beijingensis TaxID=1126833 RepID=A0A0D5NS49_9BACL|nr:hypothetical protein VN24_13985 [Paenibacillus beijingensis]